MTAGIDKRLDMTKQSHKGRRDRGCSPDAVWKEREPGRRIHDNHLMSGVCAMWV
jgi:hypothetical protein